jgi:hypothetical protein
MRFHKIKKFLNFKENYYQNKNTADRIGEKASSYSSEK